MQAHFQLLQLSVDVARVSCYFSTCAPMFLRLADAAKAQAGALMDVVLAQGGAIALPALASPCVNLAIDQEGGEPSLAAALWACAQVETSKDLEALAEFAHRHGNAELRRTADALSLETQCTRTELLRVLAAVDQSSTKLEALAHVRSLMAQAGRRGGLPA
jgi:hypothetical protein